MVAMRPPEYAFNASRRAAALLCHASVFSSTAPVFSSVLSVLSSIAPVKAIMAVVSVATATAIMPNGLLINAAVKPLVAAAAPVVAAASADVAVAAPCMATASCFAPLTFNCCSITIRRLSLLKSSWMVFNACMIDCRLIMVWIDFVTAELFTPSRFVTPATPCPNAVTPFIPSITALKLP